MTSIEKLNRVRDGRRDYEWQADRLEELRAIAERVTPSFSLAPGRGDSSKDDAWVRLMDAEAECNAQLSKYLKDCFDLKEELAVIRNPVIRTAMQYRFVSGFKIEMIAERMGYDDRWIRKLIAKGTKIYCEVYPDD